MSSVVGNIMCSFTVDRNSVLEKFLIFTTVLMQGIKVMMKSAPI